MKSLKNSNLRRDNQNPKLNTYSRLLKTNVNGCNGGQKRRAPWGVNVIIPRELGSLSRGVAGSRIRSWRTVKACSVQVDDGHDRARIVEGTNGVGAPRMVRWKI